MNVRHRQGVLADRPLRILASLSAACKTLLEAVTGYLAARRDGRILQALDDRMLSDMGISRSDIERVSRIGHPRPAREQSRRVDTN